jgi:hypothetical protein
MATQHIDTVVMSGGAPTSPLMAGFLYALVDRPKREQRVFKNFHTSGAGALMALLMLAPKKGDPKKALREWVESGIADEIYKLFPVNFKLFRKPGPFSPMFRRLAERYKVPQKQPTDPASPLELRGATGTDPLKERDPIRELLAEWLARPPHDDPTPEEVKRRRGNGLVQLYAALLNVWDNNANRIVYGRLIRRKDPIKLFRDKWLESLFTSEKQRRVYNDLVDLWFAILTPSTLAPRSEGLAASLPFLDDIVDFDRLKKFRGHFCVNAYNMSRQALETRYETVLNERRQAAVNDKIKELLEEHAKPGMKSKDVAGKVMEGVMPFFQQPKPGAPPPVKVGRKEKHKRVKVMELFEPPELRADHIRAAFSMPFIYPPTELNQSYYSEGADHEPIHFHQEHLDGTDAKGNPNTASERIVLLDVLATLEDYLVRRPRDLWDAYVISIMTPVVALARAAILEFEEDQEERRRQNAVSGSLKKRIFELEEIYWNIPSETQPYVMDWSYSNLEQLFNLGIKAGVNFMKGDGKRLPNYAVLVPR